MKPACLLPAHGRSLSLLIPPQQVLSKNHLPNQRSEFWKDEETSGHPPSILARKPPSQSLRYSSLLGTVTPYPHNSSSQHHNEVRTIPGPIFQKAVGTEAHSLFQVY